MLWANWVDTHMGQNNDHWVALARLMKYLKGAMNCGIDQYSGYPIVLEGC